MVTMKKGKAIYITKEEARAISSAINDVLGNIEAGADEEYVKEANMRALCNVEDKLIRNGLFRHGSKPCDTFEQSGSQRGIA
jgi:hypothetical protein